jgi:hypothetical protein
LGKALKPPVTKRKYGKGLYLLNLVLFMIPITYFGYQPLLRYCTRAIVVEDDVRKSDAVLALSGAEPGRAWGAADLYRQKLADYVVVTTERLRPEEVELVKLGIDLVDGRGNYIRTLRGLGVPENKIIVLEKPADDTFDELSGVRELCRERNWKSLIIVTANYHTRRTRLAARYIFGHDFQLIVTGTTHGGINRNAWWKNRADVRTFLIEFEKLVAYSIYIGPRMMVRDIWTSRNDTSHSSISLASPDSSLMHSS